MIKISVLLVWIASFGLLQDQTLWETYNKKINGELNKWSEQYAESIFLKTADKRDYLTINDASGKNIGTLVLSSAKGRFDEFDIMTVIVDGKVDLIRILKYRSEYGSEISNKKWLAQFYSGTDSIFVFRKNIDAVSGATFSAQGMVDEINNIIKSLSEGIIIPN